MTSFLSTLRASTATLALMTVLLGAAYPALTTVVLQTAAPRAANGSLVTAKAGTPVGSALIGQSFDGSEWFWPRPSAAGDGYDGLASGGSNLAADNPDLVSAVAERQSAAAAADGVAPAEVPADAVTASGSGLDPDISPEYAQQQVTRVAAARGLDVATVESLVADHTQGRALGFVGEPRVNVLELNLALSQLTP